MILLSIIDKTEDILIRDKTIIKNKSIINKTVKFILKKISSLF
jgi:hypothetical protein